MKTCPCCGLWVPDPRNSLTREGVKLSPRQARLFDIIRRSGQYGIRRDDILEIMYADADNYPAPNIVPVMTSAINHKFERAHVPVRLQSTLGAGALYRVVHLEGGGR